MIEFTALPCVVSKIETTLRQPIPSVMARDQTFGLKILQMRTRFRATENDMKVFQITKQMLRDFVSRFRLLDGENACDLFQPLLVMRTKLVAPLRQIRERIAMSRQNG